MLSHVTWKKIISWWLSWKMYCGMNKRFIPFYYVFFNPFLSLSFQGGDWGRHSRIFPRNAGEEAARWSCRSASTFLPINKSHKFIIFMWREWMSIEWAWKIHPMHSTSQQNILNRFLLIYHYVFISPVLQYILHIFNCWLIGNRN